MIYFLVSVEFDCDPENSIVTGNFALSREKSFFIDQAGNVMLLVTLLLSREKIAWLQLLLVTMLSVKETKK